MGSAEREMALLGSKPYLDHEISFVGMSSAMVRLYFYFSKGDLAPCAAMLHKNINLLCSSMRAGVVHLVPINVHEGAVSLAQRSYP